ncbi:MAG: hydrogenase [Spirochaetes bacterium GWD1_61_31]|nr:MAG: hydrogenase [Spirochaetes bacterium GWB1_60_80]OHD34568.1 MAG: hydrogenase [Spirochaetes bacterium GWC1_61_12]OHD44009.1 MAG: hydrogenase [Spirochaetes bacterium GWD1_61_31]OHD46179.1 MAG: hydrogenase [Spirochaetes bacterium GWE1_60_18]OHD60717.1 MAG: hydrogenase [Spirochaetes bacterium GWF1_60_12]HAP43894.1 hydrogenase [Spirochaetaceae bacterium]
MPNLVNTILVIVLALNLFALGNSRLMSVIRIVSAQGVLLGLLPLVMHGHITIAALLAAGVGIILKAIIIPSMMLRALRDADIKREVEPLIGFLPSIILGALATGFSLLFVTLPGLADEAAVSLVIPTSFATVLVGFILLTTRYKAISQVVGYLVLENGIFIFGLLLVEALPLVVEMGVLLDLFVGIFVISIIVNHINAAFSSLDTRHLVSLKE